MTDKSYRDSHKDKNYGARYTNTYQKGYYLHQWKKLEEPLLRDLIERYRSNGIQRVMDFACGTGRILNVLEEYFQETIGVDVSYPMLQYARYLCPHSKIFCQDITVDPLNMTVDMVTAFRFFVNAEPTLREDALKAIHATLKPGGLLLANIHQNATSILGMIYRVRNMILRSNVANVMSYEEFTNAMNRCGFSVSEAFWYSYLPRPGWIAGNMCGRLMLPFENVCRRIGIPNQLAQCFLIVAIKH